MIDKHRPLGESPRHIVVAFRTVDFMVHDAEAVEKLGIVLGGDFGQVGLAVRIVILPIGLLDADHLGATFVAGCGWTAHTILEFPHGLILNSIKRLILKLVWIKQLISLKMLSFLKTKKLI